MAPHLPAKQSLEELLEEAQHRWLNAAEIHDMFTNYGRHDILISQPQETPQSGSLFVIKRHKVREFKKDGHNWTKKKDGKTIQEAHEKLKVRNLEMIQCLYVHRQDNENFQRRIYWMLDQGASDIAIFHYLETKRSRKRGERTKDLSGELSDRSLNKCQMISQPTMERQDAAANLSETLRIRFEKLLSRSSVCPGYDHSKPLLKEDDGDWSQMVINVEVNISLEMVKEKFLKEKLQLWLSQKVAEGGNGLTELDEGGQGVLHFAAALGYNWALKATIDAGVDINFPDANKWTALRWAVHCRRQHTVTCLVSLGAAPVELFYPTPKYPLSKT